MEPIPDLSEKRSVLLKTSLSDFLSHCDWTSPPLTTTTPSSPESTEPRLDGHWTQRGGVLPAIIEFQFLLSVGTKNGVKSKF